MSGRDIHLTKAGAKSVRATGTGDQCCPFLSLEDGRPLACLKGECAMWDKASGCTVLLGVRET